MLLPEYEDGVWRGKVTSVRGEQLPSARLVSLNLVPDVDTPSDTDTSHVMQWGQFVDHDLAHTPLFRLSNDNSSGIQCCQEDGAGPIRSGVSLGRGNIFVNRYLYLCRQ